MPGFRQRIYWQINSVRDMEDNELIERYLRGELSSDETIAFEKRLATDDSFKELFEIESVIVKSLQFSLEKERIRKLATEVREVKSSSWLTSYMLGYTCAGALGVWIVSNLASGILHVDAGFLKWFGLALAFALSCTTLIITERKFHYQLVSTAVLNALVIFVISSGIDAINQGIEFQKDTSKAVIIPLTEQSVWWPTRSLVDSIVEQKRINQALTAQKSELKAVLKSLQDSCLRSTFSKIIPIIMPKALTVPVGSNYEASVFAAVSLPLDDPEITMNGRPVPLESDSLTGIRMGRIKLPADFGADDNIRRTNEVTLKYAGKEYRQRFEYYVVQPVIRVTTGNAPILYMNCANNVNIEVPALGVNYHPSFNAGNGAEIIVGDKPGKVTIIPRQRRITIGVNNAGTEIGNQVFDVKEVPAPRYVAYVGNNAVDLKSGIKANQVGTLRFVAEPEENFKAEVPKDARYRIKRAELILARGTAGIQRLNSTNENPGLSGWASQARPGDRIVIDIKEVVRLNYHDEEEVETVYGSSGIISIPIN